MRGMSARTGGFAVVRMRMKKACGQFGFSLSEVLVVVAVLGILAGLLLGFGKRLKTQADEKLCRSTIEILVAAIEQYFDDQGKFPVVAVGATAAESSEALYSQLFSLPRSRQLCEQIQASQVGDTNSNKKYEFLDPWGTPLGYKYDLLSMTFPVITSAGPDKGFGDELPNPMGSKGDNISSR